jgi:hypothetical protein
LMACVRERVEKRIAEDGLSVIGKRERVVLSARPRGSPERTHFTTKPAIYSCNLLRTMIR